MNKSEKEWASQVIYCPNLRRDPYAQPAHKRLRNIKRIFLAPDDNISDRCLRVRPVE